MPNEVGASGCPEPGCERPGDGGAGLLQLGSASTWHFTTELDQRAWQLVPGLGQRLFLHNQSVSWCVAVGCSCHVLRLVLLLQLTMARNGVWAVEQPDKSLLIRHKRMDWLVNHVAYVPLTSLVVGAIRGLPMRILDDVARLTDGQEDGSLQQYEGDWHARLGQANQRREGGPNDMRDTWPHP